MYLLYETDPDWFLSEIAVGLQSSSFCLFVTLFVLHKYFTSAPFDMEYTSLSAFKMFVTQGMLNIWLCSSRWWQNPASFYSCLFLKTQDFHNPCQFSPASQNLYLGPKH